MGVFGEDARGCGGGRGDSDRGFENRGAIAKEANVEIAELEDVADGEGSTER